MEFLSLLLGTVALRPYVFIFLAIFLFLAGRQIGWPRTLLWTVTGYCLAFAAEFSSIHWGFPFGEYYYIDTTRTRELWVAGVPFMDSLSFTFLSYIGYSCAWQLVAAFQGRKQPLDGPAYLRVRRSWKVLVLGGLITMLMDVIIDPVTLMGDRWFLGLIYGYAHEGNYFGIPLTNFAGWFLLAAAIIGANQLLETALPGAEAAPAGTGVPYIHLGGFLLFSFVVGFNLFVTAWLGEGRLLMAGISLVSLFLLFSWKVLSDGGLLRPTAP